MSQSDFSVKVKGHTKKEADRWKKPGTSASHTILLMTSQGGTGIQVMS